MRRKNRTAARRLIGALLLGTLGLGCLGCQQDRATDKNAAQGARPEKSTKSNSSPRTDAKATAKIGEPATGKRIKDKHVKPATHTVVVADQPGEWKDEESPVMPRVLMSEGHAATCLVKVGQTLPDVALADLDGHQQQLSKLMGDRLTVVVLCSSSNVHAQGELSDLAIDVASPLTARGVRVVGISEPNGEQNGVEQAREMAEKAGVAFPMLLDAEGKFFAQLATERLPRTYLLDASGKILWLDIEYSRITRHDLQQAIQSALAGP